MIGQFNVNNAARKISRTKEWTDGRERAVRQVVGDMMEYGKDEPLDEQDEAQISRLKSELKELDPSDESLIRATIVDLSGIISR